MNNVRFMSTQVAETYEDARDAAIEEAMSFYGNPDFRMIEDPTARLEPGPNSVSYVGYGVEMRQPEPLQYRVNFEFCGDPWHPKAEARERELAPVIDAVNALLGETPTLFDPEPVGPEGECPRSGEPCRELCERVCGDRLAD